MYLIQRYHHYCSDLVIGSILSKVRFLSLFCFEFYRMFLCLCKLLHHYFILFQHFLLVCLCYLERIV